MWRKKTSNYVISLRKVEEREIKFISKSLPILKIIPVEREGVLSEMVVKNNNKPDSIGNRHRKSFEC